MYSEHLVFSILSPEKGADCVLNLILGIAECSYNDKNRKKTVMVIQNSKWPFKRHDLFFLFIRVHVL